MAEKMTRRTFMKSAAVAAAAVSLSGVLVGCGGGSAAADEVKLGAYTVKLYSGIHMQTYRAPVPLRIRSRQRQILHLIRMREAHSRNCPVQECLRVRSTRFL